MSGAELDIRRQYASHWAICLVWDPPLLKKVTNRALFTGFSLAAKSNILAWIEAR